MQNWIKILTALFVAQLVLVFVLNAPVLSTQSSTGKILLAKSPNNATKIQIETEGEDPLILVKSDGQWKLPNYFNLPADSSKVEELIKKLGAMESAWPTAHTSGAQERFEVAEDKFQRRISLFNQDMDKAESVVYFGTSPGYRKTHARLAGSNDIYSVKFSNFEASTSAKSWFDASLLALENDRIKRIESPEYTLIKEEDKWRVDGLAENEAPETDKIQTYITQLANLSVEEAITTDPESKEATLEPVLNLTVNLSGSDPVTYQFALPDPATHYVVKSSLSDVYFRLPKAQGDQLVDTKRAQVVKNITEDHEAPLANTDQEDTDQEDHAEENAEENAGTQSNTENAEAVPENPAALN